MLTPVEIKAIKSGTDWVSWKETQKRSTQSHIPAPCTPHTCWLAGSCLFQVVEGLVVVTQVVKCHSRSIQRLEVLAFFLEHFEAVLLDALVIHQLGLEQAGCRGWGRQTDRQTNVIAVISPCCNQYGGREQLRWGKWLRPVIQQGCSHTNCLWNLIVHNLNTNASILGIAKWRDCVCSRGRWEEIENVNIPPQSGNSVWSRDSDWLSLQ